MKKHIFGRKFKRDVDERKALFKGLMSSLVLYEKIETTEEKAKAIKAELDKLVTNAKKDGILARKLLSSKLSPEALEKMVKDIAPRFDKRQGGYTKMVRLGKRFGDDSTMVLIEWTETARDIVPPEDKKLSETKPTAVENEKEEIKNKKTKKSVKNKRAVKSSKRRSASGGKNG
ncbi:MAG: 50S ribosomal protein L17 [Patescibacteria group bacterium]|nr:50S ribosomal protein L17 [Patescibacteria group bacterium]